MERLDNKRIHRAKEIRLRAVDPELLSELVKRLDRRMSFDLTVSDHTLYVSLGHETQTGGLGGAAARRRLVVGEPPLTWRIGPLVPDRREPVEEPTDLGASEA